jgi:hypothetical protein
MTTIVTPEINGALFIEGYLNSTGPFSTGEVRECYFYGNEAAVVVNATM